MVLIDSAWAKDVLIAAISAGRGAEVQQLEQVWPLLIEGVTRIDVPSAIFKEIEKLENSLPNANAWMEPYEALWEVHVNNTNSSITLDQYARIAEAARNRPPKALRERESRQTKDALDAGLGRTTFLGFPDCRGIINLGATCYLSATIHLIRACQPLRDTLLTNPLPNAVDVSQIAPARRTVMKRYFKICSELRTTIQAIEQRDVKEPYAPKALQTSVQELRPGWTTGAQQDAKEAFDILTNCLHDVTNVATGGSMSDEYAAGDAVAVASTRHWAATQACRSSSAGQGPVIAQSVQTKQCLRCRTWKGLHFETFTVLNVPIPKDLIQASLGDSLDLEQLLRARFNVEKLENVECRHCDQVNNVPVKGPAEARLYITVAPQYLLVQLVRWAWAKGSDKPGSKISQAVTFVLDGLNLYPYLHPDTRSEGCAVYDCIAVVHHRGQVAEAGHYIAFVRQRDREGESQWIEYNDRDRKTVPGIDLKVCQSCVIRLVAN